MAQNPQVNKFEFDLLNLIKFTWEKKWILLGISVAAFVIATIVAFAIKPKYKAKVMLFPGAEISLSKTLVETSVGSNNEKDILTFGNDVEAERLLQILRSEQLMEHLINKFNLVNYYGVDLSPKKYPMTTTKGILAGNYKCRRTELNSIEILVYDHNPDTAANIANEIARYADTIFSSITNERSKQAYEIVLNEYSFSKQFIADLTDSLRVIRSYGITDYERQAEALNKEYANALVKKDKDAIKTLESKLAVLQKYGSIYNELQYKMKIDLQRLSYLEGKVAAAKVNYEHKFSNLFIIDKASAPEKKDSPKRILIVIIATLSTFAFALLTLLVQKNISNRQ